jgi:UPF0716 protein FxsA
VADVVRRRLRTVVGLTALAELVVFLLVAAWIGLGWTIVATLVTSALGWVLLASQGRRTLADLRRRAQSREAAGRELGDAGLIAVGGLLMVLPGFLGDLIGLFCLLPGTRGLVRGVLRRLVLARLPEHMRGPVRVGSTRTAPVDATHPYRPAEPRVIEGEVLRDPDDRP